MGEENKKNIKSLSLKKPCPNGRFMMGKDELQKHHAVFIGGCQAAEKRRHAYNEKPGVFLFTKKTPGRLSYNR